MSDRVIEQREPLSATGTSKISPKTIAKAREDAQKRAQKRAAQATKQGKSKATKPKPDPKFQWYGIDAAGEDKKGVIQAPSFGQARIKLENDGFQIESLATYRPWWQLEFGNPVPPQVLVQSTRQLASFAQAGIPIAKGLQILAESTQHARMKQVLTDVHLELESGTTLSEALSHHGKVFPIYYQAIIGAAERSGDLTGALISLNDYLDRDLRSRRAIRSATYYPIVLFAIAVLAVTMLSVVVLPRFADFFASLGADLPLPTKILMWMTAAFSKTWWLLGGSFIGLMLGYSALRSTPKGKLLVDTVKLHLPFFGGLIQLIAVERFCRVLATLVRTAVPLPEAMILAARATGNRKFEVTVTAARERVLIGEGLSEPLQDTGVFPVAAIQIFHVAEESGQLEQQLSQASGFYSDELDHRMTTFTGLLEPIVLVLIGGAIGFVAVALVSAMYGVYSQVQ